MTVGTWEMCPPSGALSEGAWLGCLMEFCQGDPDVEKVGSQEVLVWSDMGSPEALTITPGNKVV